MRPLLSGEAAEHLAWTFAASTAGALDGGGAAGGLRDQLRHPAGGILAGDAREAGIHHYAYPGDGEGGLGYIGGDDDPASGGFKLAHRCNYA